MLHVCKLATQLQFWWQCEFLQTRSVVCPFRAGRGQSGHREETHAHTGMSSFSESALEKKLTELSSSQQSVQTLSLWIIHHRKHSALIVKVWHRELKKGESCQCWLLLQSILIYVVDFVKQNTKLVAWNFIDGVKVSIWHIGYLLKIVLHCCLYCKN